MAKEKSQLKTGIILNYINMGIGTLIPIFYTPVMLQILGQKEYGLYKLSSSITSYLGLLSMGLGTAVSRYLIKARIEDGTEEEERVFGLFMIFFRIVAVVAFVAGMILVFCLPYVYSQSLTAIELVKMRIIVIILIINTSLNFSVAPYLSVVSAHEKFLFLQCMNIISTCITPIANLVVLFCGFMSIGMACSSLFFSVVVRIIYVIYVQKNLKLKPSYQKTKPGLIKEIFAFSTWIFVANLVNQLNNSTDTVMIGAIPALATTGVAIYNVGITFSSITNSLTTGISSMLSPKTSKMVFSGASNTELTDLAIRIGRIQGYIVTLIVSGFLAFGQPFIHFYAGNQYAESYWVAVVLLIPHIIPLVQSVCLSIIIAKNMHKFRSIVYLGIAIGNVIGTWFMMKIMGVTGAAIMTGISLIIGQGFVMNWYYAKKVHLEIARFWKSLLPLFIVPTVMCIITLALSQFINFYNLLTLLSGIVLYTLVFGAVSWCFVMNSYEKNLLLTPIKKVWKILQKRLGKKKEIR